MGGHAVTGRRCRQHRVKGSRAAYRTQKCQQALLLFRATIQPFGHITRGQSHPPARKLFHKGHRRRGPGRGHRGAKPQFVGAAHLRLQAGWKAERASVIRPPLPCLWHRSDTTGGGEGAQRVKQQERGAGREGNQGTTEQQSLFNDGRKPRGKIKQKDAQRQRNWLPHLWLPHNSSSVK